MEKIIIKTIISSARLNNLIKDRFFYDKFGNKLQNLLANYIVLSGKSGDSGVQYRVAYEKFSENIDDILEILEELKYLNLVRLSPLFLLTRKNFLALKLELMRGRKEISEFKTEIAPEKLSEKETVKKSAPTDAVKKNLKLNQSKKKILEFIRSYPNIRTKDIITEFNVMSDRTVKRNLTDLIRTGFIKKRVDNKAVYYYASE